MFIPDLTSDVIAAVNPFWFTLLLPEVTHFIAKMHDY